MSKFDPTKPVQTRDGRKARIVATDVLGPTYPILALVTQEDGIESAERYGATGCYLYSAAVNQNDLVNVPEKHLRWVNIYPHGSVACFATRAMADAAGRNDRIACIRIEFEEGEGLS